MKGAVMLEIILVVVMVSAVFLGVIIIQDVWNDVTDSNPIFQEHATITAESDQVFQIFGYLPIILFAGSILSMIILSFFTESHPVFLGISIIVFCISIPLMAIMSNVVMGTVVSDTGLTAVAESAGHEASTQMMGNLVLWGIIGGLLALGALYGKSSR